jgi:hypothetical protein
MVLLNSIIGCAGFFLAGSAFTRFAENGRYGLVLVGVGEILTGAYFITAAIDAVSL